MKIAGRNCKVEVKRTDTAVIRRWQCGSLVLIDVLSSFPRRFRWLVAKRAAYGEYILSRHKTKNAARRSLEGRLNAN